MDFPLSTGITQRHDIYPFIDPSKFTGALTGKVVLITGASRGIGRATSLAFAAAGASVAALARTPKDINSLVSEIKAKYNTPALALTGDVVANPTAIVAQVEAALGPIDILINNAGALHMHPFADDKDTDDWWRIMEINVRAPIGLIHAVLPGFLKRGKGTVVTVASSAADLALEFLSSYVASKAALVKAVQIIDMELRGKGVKNFLIHPGAVKTSLNTPAESVGIKGEEMKEYMGQFVDYMIDSPELPAWSMVALAVLSGNEVGKGGDERVDVLSGRYWDVEDDLGEILDKKAEIEEKLLYHLRVRKL